MAFHRTAFRELGDAVAARYQGFHAYVVGVLSRIYATDADAVRAVDADGSQATE